MSDARANEWADFIGEWGAETDSPGAVDLTMVALRERITAQRRRMVWTVVADTVVSVAFVLAAAYGVLRFPGPWTRLLAVDVAGLLLITWTFAIWNRRRTWQPLGETTEAYLALLRLRAHRKLQALHFGLVIVLAQVLFVLGWLRWGPRGAPFAVGDGVFLLPIGVVMTSIGVVTWSRRRVVGELAELGSHGGDD